MEFTNYTQLKPIVPKVFWQGLRLLTLVMVFFIIYILFTQPELGLIIFWKLMIPVLPLSFAIAPGLWRNVCPMAFLNQLPRMFNKGLQRDLSVKARKIALLLSILLFIIFVTSRAPLLNHSGWAVASMLVAALLLALLGGWIFKGRSGWCGTFCPLAPLQKVYGHAPLLMVRNGYCEPCLGCQKNCYDFNPRAAIFSDINDSDLIWSDNRKYFAALLPGLIIGFFTAVSPQEVGLTSYYMGILLPPLVTVGLYYSIHNVLQISNYRLVALFGMSALGIFYWFGVPVVASGIDQVFGWIIPQSIILTMRIFVIVICVAVLIRGLMAERNYLQAEMSSAVATVGGNVNALKAAVQDSLDSVHVDDLASGQRFEVRPEKSLLDAIETAGLPIMSGCRMGMCGSDPVVIVEGSDQLEAAGENELTTLRRLGLEGKARLACCCKPKGDIIIDLEANPETFTEVDVSAADIAVQVERETIIIIGNGIAGISTAEHIREKDKKCRIILISQEPHHFYNRMGLEKVIHGHAAMQGLYLMEDDWYKHNDIDVWLNTRVVTVNKEFKLIELGTGERLNYDHLVLTTGGYAFVPSISGANLPGCFTLRDAKDALEMRRWVQTYVCKQAVVLGGGVLGVEAADALQQLGLRVTIVHSSHQLMNRQLDLHAGVILRNYLSAKGIEVITNTGIKSIEGNDKLRNVILENGDIVPADLLLFCVGIRANTQLAKAAGLEVNRGVKVNRQMQTSDENIYCAGDAAELPGSLGGLWAVGNEQGKIVAASVLGESDEYNTIAVPPVQLKVTGIDVKSFGEVVDVANADSYSDGDLMQRQWKHLVVKEGRIIGGVFVNAPQAANAAILAAKKDSIITQQAIVKIMACDR